MTNTICPKCGHELTGNGKNCIDCNTRDGHETIRDTLKTQFNSFFHERHKSDCRSYALTSVLISLIILAIVSFILTYLIPSIIALVNNLGWKAGIIAPCLSIIVYFLAFYYKKNALRKEFIDSNFK
ncbi:MAG: hypothetical protein WCP93_01135 [Candidatus Berkelbacteria bacterium]